MTDPRRSEVGVANDVRTPESGQPQNEAEIVLFTSRTCAVCAALKPKIQALLVSEFPRVVLRLVDCDTEENLARQLGIRTVPTVAVRFADQEIARLERVFSLGQLAAIIERPYQIYFEN